MIQKFGSDTMHVDVYFNLHKRMFSVRSRMKHNYGKVIVHCNGVVIENPKGVVSEKGRQRVLASKQKNVHAVVRGNLRSIWIADGFTPVPFPEAYEGTGFQRWHYDPYEVSEFVLAKSRKPVNAMKWKSVTMFGYPDRSTEVWGIRSDDV
jgi:hypothetical protein